MPAFYLGGILGIVIDCLIHFSTNMRYNLFEIIFVGIVVGGVVSLIERGKI